MSSARARRDIVQGLTSKGFREEAGRDHVFLMFEHERRTTAIFTKVSHSGKDVDARLIGLMAKQCKLSKADFLDLVDCPLDARGYVEKLTDGGFLRRKPKARRPASGA